MRVQSCYICDGPGVVMMQTSIRALRRGQTHWHDYLTETLHLCDKCWQDLLAGRLSTDIVRIEDDVYTIPVNGFRA